MEDARQAIYILEEFKKNNVLKREMDKEEIFEFAQIISTVKNKRFLDSRLHRIDEISTLDNYLKNKGVLSNVDAPYFTSLYDMWDYGALYNRSSGCELDQAVFVNIGVHEREKEFFRDVHNAHAVGSPDADTRLAGNREAALLKQSALFAGFRKTGAFDDDTPYPFAPARRERLGNGRGGDNDDRSLLRVRKSTARGVQNHSANLLWNSVLQQ